MRKRGEISIIVTNSYSYAKTRVGFARAKLALLKHNT